jgi:hypothetical protein
MTQDQRKAPGASISLKLCGRLAEKYGIAPEKLLETLRDTVFKPPREKDDRGDRHPGAPFTDNELASALVLCDAHDLSPFAREIYVTRHKGALLVVVSVDGWLKVLRRDPNFNGISFEEHENEKGDLAAITCRIRMKNLEDPIEVKEWLRECYRKTEPWDTCPRRMLRHRSIIQGTRIAVGLSGVMDEDEAERIIAADARLVDASPAQLEAPAAQSPYLADALKPKAEREKVEARPAMKPPAPKAKRSAAPDPAPRPEPRAVPHEAPPPAEPLAREEENEAREPGEEPEEAQAEPASPTEPTHEELWGAWMDLRTKLDGVAIGEIRRATGVEYIRPGCSREELIKVVRAAEERLRAA